MISFSFTLEVPLPFLLDNACMRWPSVWLFLARRLVTLRVTLSQVLFDLSLFLNQQLNQALLIEAIRCQFSLGYFEGLYVADSC
jgi:hypothetical protein